MRKAIHHLKKSDPVIGAIIERVGPCRLRRADTGFHALVRSIVSQQLSVKAAATIFGRVEAAAGVPLTPEGLLKLSLPDMRALGLSQQKASYITDLASRTATLELQFDKIRRMPDQRVIEHLTRVKGVGVWTVHMYLIFNLRRPNVLPVGDLGIRNAIKRAYKLEMLPSPEEIHELSAALASLLLVRELVPLAQSGVQRLIRLILLFAVLVTPVMAQDEPNATKGKEVFRMCSGCHHTDTDARKMGPSLRTLYGKVLLRNGKRTTDANVRELIVEGFNGMPSYKYMLQPSDLDHLIEYLKTLKGRPAEAPAPATSKEMGKSVFAVHCARCHGPRSPVIEKAGDLKDLFAKAQMKNGNTVTDGTVLLLVEDGHAGSPRFRDWLDRDSKKALIEYLRLGAERP